MLRVSIRVKEDKGGEKCVVQLEKPKDISKASENEKRVCAMVISQIEKGLKELQD